MANILYQLPCEPTTIPTSTAEEHPYTKRTLFSTQHQAERKGSYAYIFLN